MAKDYMTKEEAFMAFGNSTGGLIPITSITASNDATIDFTSGIDGTYDAYKIEFSGLRPATDGTYLRILVSEDAGSTWKTTSGNYYQCGVVYRSDSTSATNNSQTLTEIRPIINVAGWQAGNATTESMSGFIQFYHPASTALHKPFLISMSHGSTLGAEVRTFLGGRYTGAAAIDGIQFLMSSGNITSGEFTFYGLEGA